jgi:hypothetical protein
MAVSRDAAFAFPGDPATVFTAVQTALVAEGLRVDRLDAAAGVIYASAGVTILTWGENITIRVWSGSPGYTNVSVGSALKFGLVDWGKNREHIDRLLWRIGAVLHQPSPSMPAGWHPDPSRRYEFRWWDGEKWTEHVSRSGAQYLDPA